MSTMDLALITSSINDNIYNNNHNNNNFVLPFPSNFCSR